MVLMSHPYFWDNNIELMLSCSSFLIDLFTKCGHYLLVSLLCTSSILTAKDVILRFIRAFIIET